MSSLAVLHEVLLLTAPHVHFPATSCEPMRIAGDHRGQADRAFRREVGQFLITSGLFTKLHCEGV